jgi:hypothetical protein
MEAPYHSIEPRLVKMFACLVFVVLSGCLSINNHYSALDMSGPAGLVQRASNPLSPLTVLSFVLLAAALGAGASWLLLRLRHQPMQSQVSPVVVAKVNDEDIPDDEYRSEFQDPECQAGREPVSSAFTPLRRS